MKKVSLIITVLLIFFSFVACSQQVSEELVDNTTTITKTTEGTSSEKNSAIASTTKSFSNKYGSSTTKCTVSGCNNYIASSGDTNCCTVHSNKCLICKKYIDGDATYCMDCIYDAAGKTTTSGKFSNKYGSSTTKCAVSGCNNYIASSGDTNCCTVHSNKCLSCKKYIDGDATYCMDCIYDAAGKAATASSTTTKSYSYSSSNTCKYKSGGQYVCSKTATNGSYCKEHYDYLQDAYNSIFG